VILPGIILLLLLTGVAAWPLGDRGGRAVCIGGLTLALFWLAALLAFDVDALRGEAAGRWLASWRIAWIPAMGASLHLAADGLSIVMVALTLGLGILAVAGTRGEIVERTGFCLFNLMCALAGIVGVFLAIDLLLFYFFWELMLAPMYLLIAIWGHEGRRRAAFQFFIFTQAGGLAMLVAIVALSMQHGAETGAMSCDLEPLLALRLDSNASMWLMLGFFVAFAVKLPILPLHVWLPHAHAEAPTAGSVILAGLMLKTGAYGLMRFAVPLFPDASQTLAPIAIGLGVAGVLYGAFQSFGQRDLKRMIAYSSVSHLGFVLVGIYSFQLLAWQGAVLQMVCHGLATGGLFLLAGMIQQRTGTRDLQQLGGLWSALPRLGGLGMLLAMASLGLPGLGNFVAELLILLGLWRADRLVAAIALLGLVLATVYNLALIQRLFHGRVPQGSDRPALTDAGPREAMMLGLCGLLLLWLGLYPQPVIDLLGPTLEHLSALGASGIALGSEGGRP
jgi:NADH-quinone oxidoreductase subunit M